MVEKRSTGSARTRAVSPVSTPPHTPSPPGSPRSRRRPDPAGPTLTKPLLASAYIYATVVGLVWELWRRRTNAPQELPAEVPVVAEKVITVPPTVAPRESIPNDGRPFLLEGEHLRVSCSWLDPGTYGIVGDQRHKEAVGLQPHKLASGTQELPWKELFALVLRSGRRVKSVDCSLTSRSSMKEVKGLERSSILGGEKMALRCPGDLEVNWWAALLRTSAGSEVFRTGLSYRGARGKAVDVASLTMWSLGKEAACLEGANVSLVTLAKPALGRCFQPGGAVDGSPLLALRLGSWLAVEHPRAVAAMRNGTLEVSLPEPMPGRSYYASLGSAAGVFAASKAEDFFPLLRRHFHAYLGAVQAAAPRPLLHYDSWYDLRREPCMESSLLGKPFCSKAQVLSERQAMDRLLTMHLELSQRGVALEGVLLDDGWDDPAEPWRVEPRKFPVGLGALSAVAGSRGSSMGAWISPWGGMGEGGRSRFRTGLAKGFESHGSFKAFRLSGPVYYERFRNASRSLVLEAGLRFLKFDGVGEGPVAGGAGAFAADVDQLLFLAEELRREAPQLRVGVNTGSWPSPFWLMSADAIWRGGPDLGKEGSGSPQQKWITFRDAMVHRWAWARAPLFPLAALTLGGLVWSGAEEPAAYLNSYTADDFACQVWSFFFTGTQWQELLLQPSILAPMHWDLLAQAANLSKAYSPVLKDSHWHGGDPSAGEAYGYASFSCPPCSGLLSWRNPKDAAQNVTFSLREALGLPRAWPGGSVAGRWRISGLWPTAAHVAGQAMPLVQSWLQKPQPFWASVGLDDTLLLELAPLELRVLEALPLKA